MIVIHQVQFHVARVQLSLIVINVFQNFHVYLAH